MTRRFINTAIAGAAAVAAGLAGPAPAQPRLEQTGDGYSVVYDGAERGNVAGGRMARLENGGEDAVILYTGPDPVGVEGRAAFLAGGGDDAVISYVEPGAAAPARAVAGRTGAGAGGGAGRGG